MPQFWCVNFDLEECMEHGISHDFWMMQYQYEDDFGNEFQGGSQKSATTANWKRLTEIQVGDWFVAYLPKRRTETGNTFFAVGKVRTPRKQPSSSSHVSTVAKYVTDQESHEYDSGVIHYTDAPAFYEDFDDEWRSDNPLMRYAQRIDVENWIHYVDGGIPWLSGLVIPPYEIQRAFFRIEQSSFDEIRTLLADATEEHQNDNDSEMEMGGAAAEASEKTQAKCQGFLFDSKLRSALEQYSMAAATEHFESLGYAVEDHSKNHPYDLLCKRKDERLHVEVKGTQTDGSEVFLTHGEVHFASEHSKTMALFIVHSIVVSQDKTTLSGGVQVVFHPWKIEQEALKPLSYKYEVPSS